MRKWGGLFWATSLEKIIGGVTAVISFRQEDGCSTLPCRGVLSFRLGAREASGSETPRVHNVAQWCGGMAACGVRAAGGDAGDWVHARAERETDLRRAKPKARPF